MQLSMFSSVVDEGNTSTLSGVPGKSHATTVANKNETDKEIMERVALFFEDGKLRDSEKLRKLLKSGQKWNAVMVYSHSRA